MALFNSNAKLFELFGVSYLGLGRIVRAGRIEDFNWVGHAYCLMGNYYHLLVETPDANLAKGMRLHR